MRTAGSTPDAWNPGRARCIFGGKLRVPDVFLFLSSRSLLAGDAERECRRKEKKNGSLPSWVRPFHIQTFFPDGKAKDLTLAGGISPPRKRKKKTVRQGFGSHATNTHARGGRDRAMQERR